jgi:hypothetical protein
MDQADRTSDGGQPMTTTDQLAAIEARYEAAQQALANDQRLVSIRQLHRLSESANDVPALLALVREQAAKLEAMEALAHKWENTPALRRGTSAAAIRAALTATEGAQ